MAHPKSYIELRQKLVDTIIVSYGYFPATEPEVRNQLDTQSDRGLIDQMSVRGVQYVGSEWIRDFEEALASADPTVMPQKVAYLRAYSTDDQEDSPHFARLTVTAAFVNRLRQLEQICEQHGLVSITERGGPAMWCSQDFEQRAEFIKSGHHLTVTEGKVRLDAHPGNGLHHLYTMSVPIDALLDAFTNNDQVLYFSAPVERQSFVDEVTAIEAANDLLDAVAVVYRQACR